MDAVRGTDRRGRAQVTIKDVGKRAGVSPATVSRVFNQSGGAAPVRWATRRRVLEAARELGYRPNRAARVLVRQRSGLIGVLLPSFSGGFVSEVMDGLVGEAHRAGYETVFAQYGSIPTGLRRALDHLLEMRVEGIVLYPDKSLAIEDALAVEELKQMPVVLVDLAVDGLPLPLVTSDDASGIRAAVDHLVSLGHGRIAHLAGPSFFSTARVRSQAFREAMAGHGLPVPEEYVGHYDWHCDTAVEAARRLFEFEPRPSAVVAAGDVGAAGVLQAAREAGLRVPGDLAVVGFADILLCHTWSPPLTTVRQPKKALGEVAARLVVGIIAGEGPEDDTAVHLLPTELVVRESCGAGHCSAALPAASEAIGSAAAGRIMTASAGGNRPSA